MRLTYFALRAIKHKISKASFKRRATAVPNSIGHFRVPKNLTFKARLSAKPLI